MLIIAIIILIILTHMLIKHWYTPNKTDGEKLDINKETDNLNELLTFEELLEDDEEDNTKCK